DAGERQQARPVLAQDLQDRRQVVLAADQRGQGGGQVGRPAGLVWRRWRLGRGGLLEALGQQQRQVVLDQRLQLARGREGLVGDLRVGADAVQELAQPRLLLRGRHLQVQELGALSG